MSVNYRPQSSETSADETFENCCENSVPLTEERLAILGHEIRNPLGALNSALECWPSSGQDPQLTETLLQIMRRQVLQLTRLCNDLLDMGSISRGKLSINRTAIDVSQVIQVACEQIRPFVDQCGHTMTFEPGDFPVTLLGDETRLTQVFANLLHNSAKFTDRNGYLHIVLERVHNSAVIRFHDSGRGMDAEELHRIFPTDNAATRVVGNGLGIGLRLAQAIVELHGGAIEAVSGGLGHGSTFVVTLPLVTNMPANKKRVSAIPCVARNHFGNNANTFALGRAMT